MDADIVADLKPAQVDEFVSLLKADFYADAPAIREALGSGRSFNLIHYATTFKIDIFPLRDDPYSRWQPSRSTTCSIASWRSDAAAWDQPELKT
ncbi:MAG: hypothetical protein JWO19_2503 [Bryobacterales bacterium]|nr:hypothetical protein [Bryobacterales bacterium]